MIGYIVMQHWHYDSTEAVSDPSVVYFDKAEAVAEAKKYDSGGTSGVVEAVSIDPGLVRIDKSEFHDDRFSVRYDGIYHGNVTRDGVYHIVNEMLGFAR